MYFLIRKGFFRIATAHFFFPPRITVLAAAFYARQFSPIGLNVVHKRPPVL